MKRKIIISLSTLFLLFSAGAGISLLNMSFVTRELTYVIDLQQVEQYRESLITNLKTVQTDMYATITPDAIDLDTIVNDVILVEETASKCGTCHHSPQLSDRIAGIHSLIDDYKSGISQFITAAANTERTERIKADALTLGESILERVEQMSHMAKVNLAIEKEKAVNEMREVKKTLFLTLLGTFVLGIVVAFSLSRSVTKPVQILVRATRRLASGEMGATAAYDDRTELGELTRNFNAMSIAMKDGYEKIETEVHERRKTEKALKESEEFLGTIFDSIRDPFCIINRDYQIVKFNEAYAELKNIDSRKCSGCTCYSVLHGRQAVCEECIVSITFRSKDPCAKDKRETGRDGSPIWTEIYTYPIFDSHGEVSHVIEYTRDITDRKRTEDELKISEERYALAAQGANDGLWDWDIGSNKIFFSPRWKSILGYDERELTNRVDEWMSRIHPDDRAKVEKELKMHIEKGSGNFKCEHRMANRGGEYRWMLSRALALRDGRGRAFRMVGSMTDITERKSAEEQLVFDALHDSLTGLPNRALFMDRLGHSVGREKRFSKYLFGVLFLDIDRFKVLNDSLGHTVGDELLISVSKRLEESLRPGDTVARFGGDEFAILLEDLRSKGEALFIAERIQETLSKPFTIHNQEVFTAASMGIAFSTTGYELPEHLLRNADIAMYHAKSCNGNDKFKIFDATMYASAVARLQLETDLRQAVSQKEFVLHYQPIISMEDGRIAGMEALIRWMHPVQGVIPPYEFIPTVEETGMINEIGSWVLYEACTQLSKWQKQFSFDPPLSISVNISSNQLLPNLINSVKKVLRRTDIMPESLVLEITESMIMENAEIVFPLLQSLKELGVKLHIDDFGTGYSSLSYLHQFPVDVLKIDRSFVKKIDSGSDNFEIVKAITTLAQSLDMEVVAEGVETEQQLARLRELHCHYLQGFLFSRPMSSEDIEALLVKGSFDLVTLFTRTSFNS